MIHYLVFYDSGANNEPVEGYKEEQEAWLIHLDHKG
jgi:hypothetical protein